MHSVHANSVHALGPTHLLNAGHRRQCDSVQRHSCRQRAQATTLCVLQVTLTSGPFTTSSTALYAVYDSSELAAAEASGNLVISPPWIDISGSDEIRIVTATPSFASTDRPRLRITPRAAAPPARRLSATPRGPQPPAHRTQGPARSVIPLLAAGSPAAREDCGVECDDMDLRRRLQQEGVSEVDCTVESDREARCPSGTARSGSTVELAMARNGQDFVALASEVCALPLHAPSILIDTSQRPRHWPGATTPSHPT